MIRFSRTLLVGIFLVTVFTLPSLADSTISIVPASSSVSVGNSVTLDVNISGVTDLYGFQFDLNFNPALVSVVSITEGSFLPGSGATFFIPGTDNGAGMLAATADTLLTAVSGVNGDGTLAVLTLQGLMAGTTSIDLANVILLDSGLNSIPTNIANGTLMVTSGTVATPEPGSWVLLMAGLSFLAFMFSRRSDAVRAV